MAIIDEFAVDILVNAQKFQEYDGKPDRSHGQKKLPKDIEAIFDDPYEIFLDVSLFSELTTGVSVFKISIDGHLMEKVRAEQYSSGFRHQISQIDIGARDKSFSFIEIKRSKSDPEYSS